MYILRFRCVNFILIYLFEVDNSIFMKNINLFTETSKWDAPAVVTCWMCAPTHIPCEYKCTQCVGIGLQVAIQSPSARGRSSFLRWKKHAPTRKCR